jgi:hypothetical protein
MNKIHKVASRLILFVIVFIAFFSEVQMTDATAQNLVTFFSVVFGFYMTSIAILYNASYTKSLHKQIDEKTQRRGTHILKSYLLTSGYWSIFSITSIILFTTFATKDTGGILSTEIAPLFLPFIDKALDTNLLLSSVLFGVAVRNIFYMLLLMNTIIDGMIEEAKG